MDSLSGAVERITFYNPENGYTVLRLRPESTTGTHAVHASSLSREGLVTVVGNLPELSPGEHLRLEGMIESDQGGYYYFPKPQKRLGERTT